MQDEWATDGPEIQLHEDLRKTAPALMNRLAVAPCTVASGWRASKAFTENLCVYNRGRVEGDRFIFFFIFVATMALCSIEIKHLEHKVQSFIGGLSDHCWDVSSDGRAADF